MAGTLTYDSQVIDLPGDDSMTVVRAWFTSHTDGSVSGIGLPLPPGRLSTLKVVPASGGTQPTNLFDLTLVDGDGLDVLGGRGADLSNAAPTLLQFDPPMPFPGGHLSPTVANAGSGKSGTLVLTVS
jgi:hypothetical protein